LDVGAVALLPAAAGLRALVPPSGDGIAADGDAGDLGDVGEGNVVRWHAYDVDGRHREVLASLPSLVEAERALAVAVREATEALTALDVARWDDASAEQVAAVRGGRLDGDLLAPGYPSRATAVLVRARRLRSVVAARALRSRWRRHCRRADGPSRRAGPARPMRRGSRRWLRTTSSPSRWLRVATDGRVGSVSRP
jgi:hypothetical protein